MTTLTIDRKSADKWNKLLKQNEIDFTKEDIPEDSLLFWHSVVFEDECFADLEVYSGQNNLWCQMVWYNKGGYQIACSDACADTLDGEWICSLDDKYNVNVVLMK